MQTVAAGAKKKKAKLDEITKGFRYLASIQAADGSFHGDYGGPLFLLPGYVFAHYATQTPLPKDEKRRLGEYLQSVQNPDGGFGLHIEGKSYLFTTVLAYVAWRVLGVDADTPYATRAREWIRRQPGGALGSPSWGKFWLAVMGLYDYEGMNPLLPELWIAPEWLPIHPSKMWCHARVVYLPMSYLYGRRWSVPNSPLIEDIRAEIYDRPYESIPWESARSYILPNDLYTPTTPLLHGLNKAQGVVEKVMPKWLREKALAHTLDHIKHENTTTNFIDIGPVNKMLDTIAVFADDPSSEHTKKAIAGMKHYLFDGEDGLKVQGYNSSQLWDTAFILQALGRTGRVEEFSELAQRAFDFVDANQVREDVDQRERYYRDPSTGGWPFSNVPHGWPIVDCTAEGIKACLAMEPYVKSPLDKQRLFDAVDLTMWFQNDDGGWATYEKRRGNKLLEMINPSEVFGDIMTDYSYVELSSSAMQAMVLMKQRYGRELGAERLAKMHASLRRGDAFLRSIQRQDGSWEGSWAVCFTYGTWFGVKGLRMNGATPDDPAIKKAVAFLLAKQNADGGWGESYLSCQLREYVPHADGSQVVMTAWAVLALLLSGRAEAREPALRGVELLKEKQLPNGDWPKEGIAGVFNRNCMIHYRFYRNCFPLWAIAEATQSAV